jgi:hypothetical protein
LSENEMGGGQAPYPYLDWSVFRFYRISPLSVLKCWNKVCFMC